MSEYITDMSLDVDTYIEEFKNWVQEAVKIRLEHLPPIEKRNQQVEQITEEYYEKVGKFPDSYQLHLLGTYLLNHELKKPDVDKVSNTEFPVLNHNQIKRRYRRQTHVETETLDYLDSKHNKTLDSLSKKPVKKPDY